MKMNATCIERNDDVLRVDPDRFPQSAACD
jgi:hypothetical protein